MFAAHAARAPPVRGRLSATLIAVTKRPWWSRLWRRLRPPRRLEITREGRYFVFITVAVGLAAINTGNNLLYLVLGWLLSTIVASGAMSDMSLRGIRVHRRPPPRVFANRPFLMEIAVDNLKRGLSSYSLEVEDVADGTRVDKTCYFLKVPPGRAQRTSYRHTIGRRGLVRFDGVRVASRYPFNLFRKSRYIEDPVELLVYPEVRPLPPPAPRAHALGETASRQIGRRGDFFGLRDYRHGDDRHDIHWKSTARAGRLMVREYEQEAERRATVVVDNALPDDAGAAERDALERAISLAASLANAYIASGYQVRLVTRGAALPFSGGPMHLERILRELALLPAATADVPFAASLPPRTDNVLVVPAGVPRAGAPAGVTHVLEAGA
ncbi:MAG: DUF58 domain-containing protein [Deltaproteobacteria bacterium]|nr:MAG: DUF58 domain-containing protein [Deltaproteobacteria bacterium]